MNPPRPQNAKKILSQSDFPACKETLLLLQTKIETALLPFRQRRNFKFTSLFERWSNSTHSQAGVFLLRLFGGSRDPIHCGIGISKPQDTGFDKFEEMKRLEIVV
jgi:hypothetical protein